MNALASECSSGCESGWTVYLEHSFLNQNTSHRDRGTPFIGGDDGFYDQDKDKKAKNEDAGEEEEDLSMVSDASSGPPHFPEVESYFNAQHNGCFYSAPKAAKLAKRSKKRQKVKQNHHLEDQHLPSFLDDTASSPVFDFSMNNVTVNNQQTSTESMLDYSQGFSATYFEGKSSLQDHFDFFQPSLSENEVHSNKWYGLWRERDGNDIKISDLLMATSAIELVAVEVTEDQWREENHGWCRRNLISNGILFLCFLFSSLVAVNAVGKNLKGKFRKKIFFFFLS